jgi:hypothetical protein
MDNVFFSSVCINWITRLRKGGLVRARVDAPKALGICNQGAKVSTQNRVCQEIVVLVYTVRQCFATQWSSDNDKCQLFARGQFWATKSGNG